MEGHSETVKRPVADPGFPVGGGRGPPTWPLFDKNVCEKQKNWVPWGGACAWHAPPRSANDNPIQHKNNVVTATVPQSADTNRLALAKFSQHLDQKEEAQSGADPGFDRGSPDRDRPKLPTVCSSVM